MKAFPNEKKLADVTCVLADKPTCDAAFTRLRKAIDQLVKELMTVMKQEHGVKHHHDLDSLRDKGKRWFWPDAVIKAAQKLSPPVELGMLTLVKKGYDEDNKIPIQIFNEGGGKLDYKNPLRPHSNDFDVSLLALEERQVANAIGETPMYKLRLRVPPEVGAKHGSPRNASLSLGAIRRPSSTFVPHAISKERRHARHLPRLVESKQDQGRRARASLQRLRPAFSP